MTLQTASSFEADIVYPDSDGQPMAENTLQFRWIVTIQGNLDAMYLDNPDVFVAGDLLWYPVKGQPTIRIAPDAMVIFGQSKGYRGSYKQWEEGDIPPTVVFEIQSPGNRPEEMDRKFDFFEYFGVQEYYLYDPETNDFAGWVRGGRKLQPIPYLDGWVSPRLGIRFDLSGEELVIYGPEGKRFLTFVEMMEQQREAQRRAELERRDREEAQWRAEKLAERLRALGIDPEESTT